MRFSVQLPTDRVDRPDEFLSAAAIARMARAVEAAGFDAAYVTDHPIPVDDWLATGGHHSLDPFVALSFAAAATSRLRLHSNLLVLAYRNPFLVAKAVASLDVLSGGRAMVGVGAGYLEGEFEALGVPFEERNEMADEALEVMRLAWSQEGIRYRGRSFRARGNTALPRPIQKPHPPLFVGGNSKRAIRRAVELAQGWLPFPTPAKLAKRVGTARLENMQDLVQRIDYAREHARKVGRTEPLEICFVPFGMEMNTPEPLASDAFLDTVAELEAIGVSWACFALPAQSLDEYCDRVAEFGQQTLGRLP